MRHLLSLLLVGLVLATASVGASAQAAGPDTPASSTGESVTPPAAPVADGAAVSAPALTSGLPAYAPPPATLRAYWHVFVAFAIAWLLLFGYALSLGRRFASVEREIQRLRGGTIG